MDSACYHVLSYTHSLTHFTHTLPHSLTHYCTRPPPYYVPPHPQRGIDWKAEYQDYPIHRSAVWNCFSSSSLDPNVAVSFTKGEAGTIFIIHSRCCKSIQVFSIYPSEKEVVFPMGTRFHVVGHLPTTHLRLIDQPSRVILMMENKEEHMKPVCVVPTRTVCGLCVPSTPFPTHINNTLMFSTLFVHCVGKDAVIRNLSPAQLTVMANCCFIVCQFR